MTANSKQIGIIPEQFGLINIYNRYYFIKEYRKVIKYAPSVIDINLSPIPPTINPPYGGLIKI
jgi:hypothetical protein